jgi:diadenylate cyclase
VAGLDGYVLGISDKASSFFSSLGIKPWPYILLDVAVVAVLIYWGYLLLRQTRAMRIVYGLVFLVVIMLLARLLDLVLLNWLLKYFMTMLVVAIPVVFQPELRNALEKLGRSGFIADLNRPDLQTDNLDQITTAVKQMSSQKIGALIILQRKTGLRDYIEKGILLNAKVSIELLCSIFFPKSPLHDGAAVIIGNKIIAASVMLPVSEHELSSKLGSRHRAGVGITENSDAVAIIVSEETGAVSLAVGGEIERRISEDRLKNRLVALMRNS